MDLIYKKDVMLLKTVQDRRHLTRFFDRRTGSHLHVHAQLIGNNTGKGCFSKARRTIEQHMIQSLISRLCRFDINLQRLLCLLLTDIFCQKLGAQFSLDLNVLFQIFCCYDSFSHD